MILIFVIPRFAAMGWSDVKVALPSKGDLLLHSSVNSGSLGAPQAPRLRGRKGWQKLSGV
jgi:hypothetical protein